MSEIGASAGRPLAWTRTHRKAFQRGDHDEAEMEGFDADPDGQRQKDRALPTVSTSVDVEQLAERGTDVVGVRVGDVPVVDEDDHPVHLTGADAFGAEEGVGLDEPDVG